MAIKLHCPRCKRPLLVPNKKAGGYVNCASCNGRLWVPKDAPADSVEVDDVVAQAVGAPGAGGDAPAGAAGNSGGPAGSVAPAQVPLPPPASPSTIAKVIAPAKNAPVASVPVVSPPPPSGNAAAKSTASGLSVRPSTGGRAASGTPAAGNAASPWHNPTAPPVAPPAASRHKAARFISAEAAQSTLQLAEDGKLPELHLQEGEKKRGTEKKSTSVNPLVLFGAVTVCILLSISMVYVDFDSGSTSQSRLQAAARQVIEEQYFRNLEVEAPLEDYHKLLRAAQREHARGDRKAELRYYREVLNLLHAEQPPDRGLTGSRTRDKELEKQISILLSDK